MVVLDGIGKIINVNQPFLNFFGITEMPHLAAGYRISIIVSGTHLL